MDERHARVSASFERQGLMKTLGARLARVADGEVDIDMPFGDALSQQHGCLPYLRALLSHDRRTLGTRERRDVPPRAR